MRRTFASLAATVTLLTLAAPVHAAGTPNPHARCVAEFTTQEAGPGFGQTVSGFAHEFQPFGAIVGQIEARNDDCLE